MTHLLYILSHKYEIDATETKLSDHKECVDYKSGRKKNTKKHTNVSLRYYLRGHHGENQKSWVFVDFQKLPVCKSQNAQLHLG